MSARARARIYWSTLVGLSCCVLLFLALTFTPLAHSTTPSGSSVYEQVRELRQNRQFEQARVLAAGFLQSHTSQDLTRQQVEFECAMTYVDARQFGGARAAFDALVAAYPAESYDVGDPAVVIDDAWFQLGVAQLYEGETATGYDRLIATRQQFPNSSIRARALQYANRALMTLESRDWMPAIGVFHSGTIDHEQTILSNLEIVVAETNDPDVIAAAFVDVLNYLDVRESYLHQAAEVRDARRITLINRLLEAAPESRMTKWALLAKVSITRNQLPSEAQVIVDDVIAYAASHGDEQLLNDAQFTKAGIHVCVGEEQSARALYSTILARPLTTLFRGEVTIAAALSYQRDGDFETAIDWLDPIIAESDQPDDVRSCALFVKADCLRSLGRRVDALAAFEEAARVSPGTVTAELAARQQAIVSK